MTTLHGRTRLGLVSAYTFGVAVSWSPSSVYACGPSAEQVDLLLPADGADVPLNVVLQASSALSRVGFELTEIETGELIGTSVACNGHFDGNLCSASPGPLKPNTAYAWKAYPDPEGPSDAEPWVFMTTDATDTYTPVVNAWAIDVLQDEPEAAIGCGTGRRVELEFTAMDADDWLAEPANCFTLRRRTSPVIGRPCPRIAWMMTYQCNRTRSRDVTPTSRNPPPLQRRQTQMAGAA